MQNVCRWYGDLTSVPPTSRKIEVNVPLARVDDGPRSATVIASLALLRLHVSVDRIGDGRIGAACFVLVDDRGALAVVAHPRHQVSKPDAAPGRPCVPRVPEIMKMQAFRADRAHSVRPGCLPVEVPAPQRPGNRFRMDMTSLRGSCNAATTE